MAKPPPTEKCISIGRRSLGVRSCAGAISFRIGNLRVFGTVIFYSRPERCKDKRNQERPTCEAAFDKGTGHLMRVSAMSVHVY